MADRPLAGRRIVVTRPRKPAAVLARELERLGATAIVVPLVEVVPADDSRALDAALGQLDRYDWVVFTSANGVAAVRERLPNGASLGPRRVAAVGSATAAAVRELGVEPAFVPERFDAAAIAHGLGQVSGSRVLLPQADIASPRLADDLRRDGATVDVVVAYRTVTLEPSRDALTELAQGADAIVLASGSAASSLAAIAERIPTLREAFLVCIGPRTAEIVRELGLPIGLVADEASADGIIQALTTHFGEST